MSSTGTIKKVAGPLVIAEGMRDANMYDVVRVSDERLIGEIIEMHGDRASIQVYEETQGLGPGEPVESTDAPLSVELGPGLIGSIYDGIQRPLNKIREVTGSNLLARGVEVPSLDREKKWEFEASARAGDEVEAGDVIGTVKETTLVTQKIMVPYGIKGTIVSIASGLYTIEDTVAAVKTESGEVKLTLMQKWPVRAPVSEEAPAGAAARDRAACYRCVFPDRERRRRRRAGTVRFRKDGHPASARQVGGCGYRRLYRMRRARKRNDRCSE